MRLSRDLTKLSLTVLNTRQPPIEEKSLAYKAIHLDSRPTKSRHAYFVAGLMAISATSDTYQIARKEQTSQPVCS